MKKIWLVLSVIIGLPIIVEVIAVALGMTLEGTFFAKIFFRVMYGLCGAAIFRMLDYFDKEG